MSTETIKSFNWLRKIPGELFKLDEKPLLGFPPPFPWDKFSDELNKSLQGNGITVTPGQVEWLAATDLFKGLGEKLKGLVLTVAPLQGPVWWVMSEKAVNLIVDLLIAKQPERNITGIIDEDFLNAYLQFIAIEAISAFEKTDFDKKLSITINEANELPKDPCLGIDVTIKLKDDTIYGRLLLSQAFKKAWAQKYAQQQKKMALESPMADSLDVLVHLEAGKIDLKPSEWKQLAIGDFVLIDSCSLDPDEDKGRVMLVINGTPCFRAKIKQGSLKILEHPLYHEVDKSMPAPTNKDDKAPKDAKNVKDTKNDDDLFDDDEDDKDHGGKDEDIDFDIDEENDIEKSASPTSGKPAAEKAPAAAEKKPPAAPSTPHAPSAIPLSVEEIPLPVVIEVGRIQMSIKKLLELQPGNMLELDIHPESGVDMVVNGKRIARGELLRIGDALGLRITELS